MGRFIANLEVIMDVEGYSHTPGLIGAGRLALLGANVLAHNDSIKVMGGHIVDATVLSVREKKDAGRPRKLSHKPVLPDVEVPNG